MTGDVKSVVKPKFTTGTTTKFTDINKEPKLLKQLQRQKELNVWEKIFIYKNSDIVLNFEILRGKDLI